MPLPLLTSLQKDSFGYFVHEVNPLNGLIKDKTAENWPASIAAVGMALTIYTIGVERGFMSRAHAAGITLTTLRFFANSEQSTDANATGYKGFYYHFLDMESGKRAWQCELSSIDTALLMAGILTVGQYFDHDNAEEEEIRRLAELLYARVDWPWMLAGSALICHGWKPESGFLQWHWEGYDEALILYLLALGAPRLAIAPENYAAWTKSYEWKSVYDLERGVERSFFDYIARGAPFGPDDGTLAPWAVAASLPFAPEVVLPTVENFNAMRLREVNPYGFKASFSPTFHAPGMFKAGWVSPYHFGINEGPTVIMIENHLHDFPWRMLRANPYLIKGLRQAGFQGGWLAQASPSTPIESSHAHHT